MIARFKELSGARLRKAAAVKDQIERLEKQLTGLLGIPEQMTVGGTIRRHRKISSAARTRISTAAKSRWNKARTANG